MQVVLRKMCINDMEMVRQWRMMPEVTKYMYTDPIITLEQQIKWYDKVSKVMIYIGLLFKTERL